MKVSRRETTNPRAKKPARYAITDLTPAEYETILRALTGASEDREAAALLRTLSGLTNAEEWAEINAAITDSEAELKRLLDD